MKYIYQISKDGKVEFHRNLTGITQTIGVVASTVCKYCDTGERINGWLITREEDLNATKKTRTKRESSKPRKTYFTENSWRCDKFSFEKNDVICSEKTFKLNAIFLPDDLKSLKEKVLKALMKLFKKGYYDYHIQIAETKQQKYSKVKNRLFTVQIYNAFLEKDSIINEVQTLINPLKIIDSIVEEFQKLKAKGDS